MLRACKRVLAPGGRLVFDVVSVPTHLVGRPDLDGDYGFVATPKPYEDLLALAGFSDVGVQDTTAGYIAVAERWLDAVVDLEAGLRSALGDDVFEDKVASRRSSHELLLDGRLSRTLYWAKG